MRFQCITEKADCTITMSDDDLLGMMTGTLNAQKVNLPYYAIM